jgi:pilus assembly protein Flp/PilA
MTRHAIAAEATKKPTGAPAILLQILRDESGQDLIEYALVAALVGLGAVASMKTLSTKIGTAFTTIGTSLTSNV